jgi:hypothetical protein
MEQNKLGGMGWLLQAANVLFAWFAWFALFTLPGALLLGIQWLYSNPTTVEFWYAGYIWSLVTNGLRSVAAIFPFNFGEYLIALFMVGLGIVIAVFIAHFVLYGQSVWNISMVRFIRACRMRRCLWRVSFAITLLMGSYYILWGLAYFRPPLYQMLGYSIENITLQELEQVAQKHVDSANHYGHLQHNRLQTHGGNTPNILWYETAHYGYDSLAQKAGEWLTNHAAPQFVFTLPKPLVRPMTFSWLMSISGTSGVYNIFTGEANLNVHQPFVLQPFVACHELAHQLGFAPEDEANYLGYLSAVHHPDVAFKYAGHLKAAFTVLNAIYSRDSLLYESLANQFSPLVQKDREILQSYWKSMKNPLQDVFWDIYDLFLRSNAQKDGNATYGRMIVLLVGEFRQSHIFSKP